VAYGLSGSDANDGALKLVRASTGRPKVIAFLGSYHGNTYGALSLSAVNLAMRRRFGPAVPDVYHIPYPDVYRASAGQQKAEVSAVCLKALTHLLETIAPPEEVAAVFLEPIQGDAGIIEPPVEFVGGLQQICRQHGILIVAEEVQTGMARTGPWFASEYLHLDPDVIVIGKALASGMPLSAIVARAELMEQWQAPGHVFSTGANPVCCAAASATISVIEEEHLGENAASVGKYLREQLEQLGARYEFIGDIRGRGLMLGVDLVMDRRTKERARALASKVVWRCYELGLFLTFLNGSVLRIAPPLVVTLEQAEAAVAILAQALDDSVSGRVPDSVVEKVKGW
jgi:4-aminobutyrate aminotransferase